MKKPELPSLRNRNFFWFYDHMKCPWSPSHTFITLLIPRAGRRCVCTGTKKSRPTTYKSFTRPITLRQSPRWDKGHNHNQLSYSFQGVYRYAGNDEKLHDILKTYQRPDRNATQDLRGSHNGWHTAIEQPSLHDGLTSLGVKIGCIYSF